MAVTPPLNPADLQPYAQLRAQFPLRTKSYSSFEKLLKSLGSVQTNKLALASLNQKPKQKESTGLVDRLLNQRTGIISAPGRFVSGSLQSLLGNPTDNPQLEGLDPLTAGIKSFKGDFAVTGGDVFKIEKGDDVFSRIGKYIGALGYDLATDPLNWFGGESLLTRQAAGKIAVRQGPQLLDNVLEAVTQLGGKADDVAKQLLESSPEYARALTNAGEAGLALTPQQVREFAGGRLGGIVAESLAKGGRGEIAKQLSLVVGDEKVARELLSKLPSEISGGFFLKNPITGRPITRLAGGHGYSNVATDFLNHSRFWAGTSISEGLTRTFGGKFGPGWAEVNRALRGADELVPRDEAGRLLIPTRTTFEDIVHYKDTLQTIKARTVREVREAFGKIQAINKVRNSFKSEEERALFSQLLLDKFHDMRLPLPENATDLQKAAYQAAQDAHEVKQAMLPMMQEAGYEVNNLGDFYVPLFLTDEALADLRKQAPRGAGTSRVSQNLNPARERDSYVAPLVDGIETKSSGFVSPSGELLYKNPTQINKQLIDAGEIAYKKFEEDPLIILSKYLQVANRNLEAFRFASAARASGIIAQLPPNVAEKVVAKRAALFTQAVSQTKGLAADAVKAAEDDANAAIAKLLDKERLDSIAEISLQQNIDARDVWRTAKDGEDMARAELIAADRALVKARPTLNRAIARLRQYGKTGAEQGEQAARLLERNAAARLRRARRALDEKILTMDGAREFVDIAEQIGTPEELKAAIALRDAAEAAAQKGAGRVEDTFFSAEDAVWELKAARDFRVNYSELAGRDAIDEFMVYERALERQAEATNIYEQAVARRRAAYDTWNKSRKFVDPNRVGAIEHLAVEYTSAYQTFLRAKAALKGKPISSFDESIQVAYKEAKKAAEKAFKEIETIMAGTAKNDKTLVNKYLRSLKAAAQDLSSAQLQSAMVLADVDRLGDLVVRASYELDNAPNITMSLMGDMYATYSNIRDLIDWKTVKDLSLDAKTLARGEADALLKREGETAAAAEALMKKTGGVALGAAESAARANIPRSLEYTYTSQGVAAIMERLYHTEHSPSQWSKFIDKIYDPLMLIWKTGATVGRGPAYTVTNLVGGLMNNYLAGVSLRSHNLAAAMLAETNRLYKGVAAEGTKDYMLMLPKIEEGLRKKFGNVMVNGTNIVDLYAEFLERGGFFTGELASQMQELVDRGLLFQGAQERTPGIIPSYTGEPTGKLDSGFRKVTTFMLNNPYQRFMNDMAQGSETFMRFAAFLHGFEKYGDIQSGMDLMFMLHFDYQDLAPAEAWLKRIVPFYSWTRNNVPLQLRAIFMQPGKVSNLLRVNEEAKQAFGSDSGWMQEYLPEFMSQQGGFVSSFKFAGNHLALFYKAPLMDVNRLINLNFVGPFPVPMPNPMEVGNMAGPAIKTPIEYLFKINLQTGQKYSSYAEAATKAAQNINPYYGTLNKLASATGLPPELAGKVGLKVDQDRRVSNLMGLLVGAPWGATTITESGFSFNVANRNRQLSAQVKSAAAKAGVDVDWLRKQIQGGRTPLEIHTSIMLGEGSSAAKTLDAYLNPKKPKNDRDYSAVVRALQSGGLDAGY